MASVQRQTLTDRLKSLGVNVVEAKNLPLPKPKSSYEIDSVIAGAFCSTPLGDVFFTEQAYLPDYRHGISPILSNVPLSSIAQWANDPRLAKMPLDRFAFLDTETSGLSGGTGTYAFLVGIASFARSGRPGAIDDSETDDVAGFVDSDETEEAEPESEPVAAFTLIALTRDGGERYRPRHSRWRWTHYGAIGGRRRARRLWR